MFFLFVEESKQVSCSEERMDLTRKKDDSCFIHNGTFKRWWVNLKLQIDGYNNCTYLL